MRFPSTIRRLRNTQGGMRSTARSGSTPYDPYTDPPPDDPFEVEAGDPQTVSVGDTVEFEGSVSNAPAGADLTYTWAFGEGATEVENDDGLTPSCEYDTLGEKTVRLTVSYTDTNGDPVEAFDEVIITVESQPLIVPALPPVARAGSNQSVGVNKEVSFDGSDSTSPSGGSLTYTWDFDDETDRTAGSEEMMASYTYRTTGAKRVTLTVRDSTTELTDSDEVIIIVEPLPVADAGDDQTVGVHREVSFDGSGSEGSNLSYSWDFGADATPATGSGETVSCTYGMPGAKTVTLTVTARNTGLTDSDDGYHKRQTSACC